MIAALPLCIGVGGPPADARCRRVLSEGAVLPPDRAAVRASVRNWENSSCWQPRAPRGARARPLACGIKPIRLGALGGANFDPILFGRCHGKNRLQAEDASGETGANQQRWQEVAHRSLSWPGGRREGNEPKTARFRMADHPLCCIAVLQSLSMRLGSGDRRLATRACNLVRMSRQRPRVSGRKSKPNTAAVAQPRPSRTAALTEVWNWPSIRRQLGLSRECPMAIVRSPAAFPKSARRELPLNPRRRHAHDTNKGRYHRPSVRQAGPAAMRANLAAHGRHCIYPCHRCWYCGQNRTTRLPVSQTAKTAYAVETIPNAKVKNPYGKNASLARHEPCVLCGSASRMFVNGDNRAVDCEGCGRYLITTSASDMVDERRAEGTWTKPDSAFVSGFIRYHRAAGQDADWVLVTIATFEHLRVPRAAATVHPAVGRPGSRGTSLSN